MLKKGFLLDRDGVINEDLNYVGFREQFRFKSGIFPFLRRLGDLGYTLAILTNQAGVARGYYTKADFLTLTQWMKAELAREGISVDLVLASFEHRDGTIARYSRDSYWRKPNPGMVLEAQQRLKLDRERSAFLGDKITDMEAADAGGIKTCLWLTEEPTAGNKNYIPVKDFNAALTVLLTG